jgi:hypothetical protein
VKASEQKERLRKKAGAYHKLFTGPNAKYVLEDLNNQFNRGCLRKSPDGSIDPNASIAAAGSREVLLYIDDMMRIADATTE